MIIKPILGHHQKTDGTRQIKIYIYYEGSKELIPTKYYVKPSEWKDGKVKNTRLNADYINSEIRNKIGDLERTWLKNKETTTADLKALKIKKDDIIGFINQYILDIGSGKILNDGKPYGTGTIRSLKLYTKYIKNYCIENKTTWSMITQDFYDSFINHMRNDLEFKDNTIARAIKVLKLIMKKSLQKGLHINTSYMNFKAAYHDTDTIALTEDEMKKWVEADIDDHLKNERDRFYVSYNLLLRFGDSIKIDKRNIIKKDGKIFVSIIHEKTQNSVIIPLMPHALEILKRNNFVLSKTTNQESNRKLKTIGELAKINTMVSTVTIRAGKAYKNKLVPKHKLITTHTARRSMATNLYLAGFDIKEIQLMGGWKSITVLEKYLKIDKFKTAIKAGQHPFFN